jgi:arabinofuranosyltransferase
LQRSLSIAIIVAVFAAGVLHAWLYRMFQPDDTFIVLVYAKNLLAGNGLTFNGERVEGFSSALWTLLVSAAGALGFDLLATAKAMAVLLYLATGCVLARIASSLRPLGPWALAGLLAMYFAQPQLALWASGALETILFTFVLTLACYLYFRASCITALPRDHVIAGVAFGLLAWTRPEGIAYIGAIPVFELLRGLVTRSWNVRNALRAIASALVLFIVLVAWRRITYGDWLPSTVSAKTGDMHSQLIRGGFYLKGFFADHAWRVAAYAVATIVLLLRRGPLAWWALLSLIVVTGETCFAFIVGGDWMLGYRFLVPMLPLAISVIYFAASIDKRALVATVAFVLAAGVLQSTHLLPAARAQAISDLGDIRMGQYIRDLHLPPQSRIAVLDAGAIPYFSGLPAIDMAGLNNAHIAHLPGGFMAKWDNEYVLSLKPVYVQFHTIRDRGFVIPSEAFAGTSKLYYSKEFQRWYEFDPNSPVAHLFRRRETPVEHTFSDTFADAQWQSTWDTASGKWIADLRKTGENVWPAPPDATIHFGKAYVRLQLLGSAGDVRFEKYVPLPKSLVQGESAHLEVDVPKIEVQKIKACLLLFAVVDTVSCAPES